MDITSYASAMSSVSPGTFAPDISATPKAEPLVDDGTDAAATAGAGAVTFKDALKDMLGHVNDQMVTAEQKSSDLALGKSNDLEGTVKSLEEAGLSMQMTMAVRNKLMDAYTEVNRMTF
jgi:flagellar hook-basal body complex protein FliE